MPVYRVTETAFEPLDQTSFEREGILERQGIQARLRDRPEVLEEGLYILAEEFSSWDESSRRIDLLALDREGRLVVVELKRSDQDSFMDLQAVRYAAMVAGMTLEQAVGAHQNYLSQRGFDPADAASRIQQQLSGDDTEAAIDSRNPRVILVSADFSKELTTSVLWLNEIGMAVTCVKLELYRAGNDLYLEGNRVIPLPEAEEYLVRLTGGQNAASHPPPPSKTHQGVDEFRKAAETARPDSRDLLLGLCDLAVSLEAEGVATISTRVGSYNTVLRAWLPGTQQALFYVFRNEPGWGYLQFSGRNLERYSPRAKELLERVIEKGIGPRSTLWELPAGTTDALSSAFREAAGEVPEDESGGDALEQAENPEGWMAPENPDPAEI